MINSFNLEDKSRVLCKSPNERKKKGGQNHCIENKGISNMIMWLMISEHTVIGYLKKIM